MRSVSALVFAVTAVVAHAAVATATCPPDCFPGGGPATTDCFVQFGGIAANSVTCTDGDASCDVDGAADGICTFALSACIDEPSSSCTATALTAVPSVKPGKDAASQGLAAALGALPLSTPGCTPAGFAVPVKPTLKGLKPGKVKLTVTAAAGGKKDADKLKLACLTGTAVPSLANDVQPIFTATCAVPSCHVGIPGSGDMNLETTTDSFSVVNKPATSVLAKGLKDIEPGNIGKSYLARKIMHLGLGKFDGPMPQGCPGSTPCLTDAQLRIVLLWIQGGAPNN